MVSFPVKFLKQAMMRKVLYSLAPIQVAAIYFFGWRTLLMSLVSIAFAVFSEWLFKRHSKKPVSEAALVTAVLYAMTLPPNTPFWITAVGISFGIVFGKEVFGGFGKNVFNPALVGRAFVYICFPIPLATHWQFNLANEGFPAGFSHYLSMGIDTLSTATPLMLHKNHLVYTNWPDLFLGNVAGSIGETSALLILLAGAYLLYTKTAAYENMFGMILGFLVVDTLCYLIGVPSIPSPLIGLLSGGLLFGAVFMITDPISSPKTKQGKWIYGFLAGALTVLIRGFSLFNGGVMFAILIGNTFAPLIDEMVKLYLATKKEANS